MAGGAQRDMRGALVQWRAFVQGCRAGDRLSEIEQLRAPLDDVHAYADRCEAVALISGHGYFPPCRRGRRAAAHLATGSSTQ